MKAGQTIRWPATSPASMPWLPKTFVQEHAQRPVSAMRFDCMRHWIPSSVLSELAHSSQGLLRIDHGLDHTGGAPAPGRRTGNNYNSFDSCLMSLLRIWSFSE